ncbi:hypothetical protein Tco_1417006, partial [Tanacetum coccineum]
AVVNVALAVFQVSTSSSFHTTSWFNVRASAVLSQSAGVAFAAKTGSDEDDTPLDGLEASKLGISQEIVNALAKRLENIIGFRSQKG